MPELHRYVLDRLGIRILLVKTVPGISDLFRLEFDVEHVESLESVPYVPYGI